MVGFCHLREAPRMFRLDRIKRVTPHEARFEPPADFDYLGYVIDHVMAWGGAFAIEVLLRLNIDDARRRVPPGYGLIEPEDGGVRLRSQAASLEWFAGFLLGLDCPMQVRQPDELKSALRRVARRYLRLAQQA